MCGARRHRGPRRLRAVGWLLLAALCLTGCLAGTAAGTQQVDAENDTGAPEWTNATGDGPREIALLVSDDGAVDPSSIDASDFAVSAGNVTNVTVESVPGDNRTVRATLRLDRRLDTESVTVTLVGAVADTAGNELTSGRRTVAGMDSLGPRIEDFAVSRVNESTAEVTLTTHEPLGGVDVAVTGPVADQLNLTAFTPVDGSNTTVRTRYTVPEYGAYSFVVERTTDRYGNDRRPARMEQFRYVDSPPEIVFDGPRTATVEEAVTFSVAESTDEDGIEGYRWRLDGATVLTGERIQVAFASAGRHEVAVEVTDTEGNTAVETVQVQVRDTADRPGAVTITRHNATHADATVTGTGLVQQVRPANGSLVERDGAALDSVSAAFPANGTAALDIRATDRTPTSVGGPWFGLFALDHETAADRVSLRFSVDRDRLNGTSPGEIRLYRNADGWRPLETSVVRRGETAVSYQATAPGLSEFAVGVATPREPDDGTAGDPPETTEPSPQPAPGRPDITLTNVTLNATALSVGDTVRIDVTASNRGTANGSYPFSVRLNDSSLATHEIAVPAGETVTRSYVHRLGTEGWLAVAGDRVANVTAAGGGSLLPASVTGVLSTLPNPLALWPSGLVGTVLGAVVGLLVVVYGVLKALAIYLGY